MGQRRRSAVAISIVAVWLLGVMVQGSLAQISQSCILSFSSLSDPCDPFFTPGNTATPSPSCCTPLGAVLASDPTCICDVVVAAAARGTTLNRTRLAEIFVQCQVDVPANATYCLPSSPPSPSISSPPPTIVTPSPPIVTPSPAPGVIVTSPPPLPLVTPSPPLPSTPPPLPQSSPPPLTPSPPPPSTTSPISFTPSPPPPRPPPPPPAPSSPSPPSSPPTPPSPPSTPSTLSFGLGSAGNSLLHASSLLLSLGFILLTLLATFII